MQTANFLCGWRPMQIWGMSLMAVLTSRSHAMCCIHSNAVINSLLKCVMQYYGITLAENVTEMFIFISTLSAAVHFKAVHLNWPVTSKSAVESNFKTIILMTWQLQTASGGFDSAVSLSVNDDWWLITDDVLWHRLQNTDPVIFKLQPDWSCCKCKLSVIYFLYILYIYI